MWQRRMGMVVFLSLLAACDTQINIPDATVNASSENNVNQVSTNNSGGAPFSAPSVAPAAPSTTETAGQDQNHAPVIHSLTSNPGNAVVRADEKITFNVVATDADSDDLSYTWSSTQGTLSSTSGLITHWSPLNSKGELETGTATITVLVSDGKTVATASVNIQMDAGLVSVQSPAPTPTATPTATNNGNPTPTATPWPTTPPSQGDDWDELRNTFNGKVYDDTNAPLDGVTVTARSLNSSVQYEVSTTTAGGTYAFNNAPTGIQIEIIATRSGYTTRRRVEVIEPNSQSNPDVNRYDFGTDGSSSTFGVAYNALSDKPEVTMATPGRNASGIDPDTSFVLKFSEPMDRNTVTDNFEIRAYTDKGLTVDNGITFSGSNSISNVSGDRIWDKSAFNAIWNSDDTEVTMTFKEERMLPTDKDRDRVPDYQIAFKRQNGQLKDKSGIARASEYFKLTDGNFEQSYKFSINTDEDKPTVDSITVSTAENSDGTTGDMIKVRFSERMFHSTLAGNVAGGMEGTAISAPAGVGMTVAANAANNYYVSINNEGEEQWGNFYGGTAVFDSGDPTRKTVTLVPPTAATNIFAPGDDIEVRVAPTVLDPAGNSIDASGDGASAVAS